MSVAFPQDNVLLPTGKLSQSWQRFFQNFASQVGDANAYTVVPLPSSGAFVSVSATARYQKINGWVFWQVVIDVSNNGTGAGSIAIPMPVASFAHVVGSGRNLNTGAMLQCTDFLPRPSGARGTNVSVYNYDGSYPVGASGTLQVQMVYEVI